MSASFTSSGDVAGFRRRGLATCRPLWQRSEALATMVRITTDIDDMGIENHAV